MAFVLTKAALAVKNAENNVQVVKFESYKSKAKPKHTSKNESKKNVKDTQKEVDLKKIRHEVVKFGMSGFDPTKKEEAKIALAVSLGAKPPKRQYINYKDLIKKRKEEKIKLSEEKQLMVSKTMQITKKTTKRKGVGNDVGNFLSNYGKVQKKDLKNDKSTPKKKKK